jgi:DNA polymerase-3 subunit alpha
MAELKPEFVEGCRASGTGESVIEFLWATNEKSADYSFNKSHAACYALISYRTAWLRANYPAEYMAALISSVMDTKDKVPFFVAQAEQMGIEILPPDVNLSDHRFVVVEGNIRFGLDAVKGVGHAAVEAIKAARADAPLTDLWDFCARIDNRAVNKKAIEALIKCGAFGSTGDARKGMLMVLEQAQAAGQKAQQDALIGQGSFFDLAFDEGGGGGGSALTTPSHAPIPAVEYDRTEMLALEKESIGLFISAHPLKEVSVAMAAKTDCSLGQVGDRRDGDWVTVGGIVSAAKRLRTKKGDWMMFATLDDLEGSVELIVFSSTLEECAEALEPDSIVLVRGRVDHKDQAKICVVAQKVERFQPTQEELVKAEQEAAKAPVGAGALRIRLDAGALPATVIGDLKDLLSGFPGESMVVIELRTRGGPRRLQLGPEFRVERGAGLHAELSALLGSAILAPDADRASAGVAAVG